MEAGVDTEQVNTGQVTGVEQPYWVNTLNILIVKISIYPLSEIACLLHKVPQQNMRVNNISTNRGLN